MAMKQLFDKVSLACSKLTTRSYSTSFSLGIYCLNKRFHNPVYSIYGFVRLADEIVDSFHDYDREALFQEFSKETWTAIERRISTNPVLNAFQHVVHHYNIPHHLITTFLASMEMDLKRATHTGDTYTEYIVGSAEVVGLMCLCVFTENKPELYNKLEEPARKLGAAFQKVNFLRDMKADYECLGRMYFPGVSFSSFSVSDKLRIEADIESDFEEAFEGIKQLPSSSRFGVYVAYVYYRSLFRKIRAIAANRIQEERIRISNPHKLGLLVTSYVKHTFSMI